MEGLAGLDKRVPGATHPHKSPPPRTGPMFAQSQVGARAPVPGDKRLGQDPGRDKTTPEHTHKQTNEQTTETARER